MCQLQNINELQSIKLTRAYRSGTPGIVFCNKNKMVMMMMCIKKNNKKGSRAKKMKGIPGFLVGNESFVH